MGNKTTRSEIELVEGEKKTNKKKQKTMDNRLLAVINKSLYIKI